MTLMGLMILNVYNVSQVLTESKDIILMRIMVHLIQLKLDPDEVLKLFEGVEPSDCLS